MPYSLGVDLGTTFSTVAVLRQDDVPARLGSGSGGNARSGDGWPGHNAGGSGSGADRIEMADVGGRGFAVPSVLFVGSDGTVLVGEAAARRAATDPLLVVREIKRRLGDPAPIIIGDAAYSPALLTAALLRGVLAQIIQAEGADPQRVMLTHPANWGSFRRDVFIEAANLSGLGATFELITEPVAAALWHARRDAIPDGTVLATYDLGGGTFDAAVLAKRGDTFEVLGQPMGLDKLGGVDFDEALIAFVDRCLGGAVRRLDPASDAAARTMRNLRQEVVAAKETLSTDVAATINVALPDGFEAVRVTRREFEDMIRAPVGDTLAVMRATLEDAGVAPKDVHKMLLVGGSSRIPLVFELIERELGITAALDDHPKNVVALGAALALAGRPLGRAGGPGADHAPPAGEVQRSSTSPPAAAEIGAPPTVFGAPLAHLAGPTERAVPDPQSPGPSDRGDEHADQYLDGQPGDIPDGLALLVVSGPDGGAVRPLLANQGIEVGRDVSPGAGWALYDPRVSRRHALVSNDGATVQVQDLGSLNHSYLDGSVVATGTARQGQTLRFGNTVALLLARRASLGAAWPADVTPLEPVAIPVPVRGGRFVRKGFDTDQYSEQLEQRRAELVGLSLRSAVIRRHRHPVAGYRWIHPVPLRRRGDRGFLEVTVGYADGPTEIPWSLPADLDGPAAAVAVRFTGSFVDREVPVVLGLHGGRRLAVEGPLEAVMGVLRQLLAQVVLHHHPADVAVAVITGDDPAGDLGVSLGPGQALGIARTTLVRRPHLRRSGAEGGHELIGPVAALEAALGSPWGDRHLVMVGQSAAVSQLRQTLLQRGVVAADRLSELAVGSVGDLGPGSFGLVLQAEDGIGRIEGSGAPLVSGPMLPASLNATNAEHLLAVAPRT